MLLQGDLGAGKTVVAQGVGRGLGVPGIVNSPTFVLVNEHLGGRLPMLHADLYRLDDAAEIAELVLDELAADGVLLVEWPERSTEPIAEDVLRVTITPGAGPEERTLTWEARGDRSRALLDRLRAASGSEPAQLETSLAVELSIDSVGMQSSVAVSDAGRPLVEVSWPTGRRHTPSLLPTVDAAMRLAGAERAQLTAVFVDVGPGAYGGIRAGMAAATGIALALGLPAVGVGRLEIEAYAQAAAGVVAAVHAAGRRQWAVARYRGPASEWVQESGPRLVPADDSARRPARRSRRRLLRRPGGAARRDPRRSATRRLDPERPCRNDAPGRAAGRAGLATPGVGARARRRPAPGAAAADLPARAGHRAPAPAAPATPAGRARARGDEARDDEARTIEGVGR